MEGISIHGPRPRADVLAAIAAERERLEQRAHRHAERVEQRARGGTCPGCGFGGYQGRRCVACHYAPGEVEHRSAASARGMRCGVCGGSDWPKCGCYDTYMRFGER